MTKGLFGREMVQPPRSDRDGEVAVTAIENDGVLITVVDQGERQAMRMSRHNAFRVYAILGFMLGIPLPQKVAKEIKL